VIGLDDRPDADLGCIRLYISLALHAMPESGGAPTYSPECQGRRAFPAVWRCGHFSESSPNCRSRARGRCGLMVRLHLTIYHGLGDCEGPSRTVVLVMNEGYEWTRHWTLARCWCGGTTLHAVDCRMMKMTLEKPFFARCSTLVGIEQPKSASLRDVF
jgi:hypothetical protein